MGADLSVTIGPLTLSNPVGVASEHSERPGIWRTSSTIDRLGTLYTKAVTSSRAKATRLLPADGNAVRPHQLHSLANPGLDVFLREKLPYLQTLACKHHRQCRGLDRG